jgi:hypothetical protein
LQSFGVSSILTKIKSFSALKQVFLLELKVATNK